MPSDIRAALPATCNVQVPRPGTKPQDTITDRWSDILLSLPHAVVTPNSTADIIATIEYANKHKLKIIPAGGGRGAFVPITDDVIYINLQNYSSFELDEDKREVRIGGGCISGPLLKSLEKKGYYTAVPNSNGVGMTGALLGGLNHPLAALHGMGIDMVKSFTIIPFSSPSDEPLGPVTVSRESTGDEKNLFDVLRGAGHGMGVIISTTLEIHPIANLNLDEGDKVWQRSLVFAPTALSTAVDTYLTLQSRVPPEMNFFLIFMRAPPTAPGPGAPVIILSISFFGPSSAAQAATAITFSPEVLAQTVNAATTLTPFSDINNVLDPINKAGGFKELRGAFVHSITASSLQRVFASYISFTENHPERSGSSIIIPVANTTLHQRLADRGGFFNPRDRGIYVQVKTSYPSVEGKSEADAFAHEVHEIAREEDRSHGRRDWAFANNMVEGMSLGDVYTREQIAEIYRVNYCWNRGNVGWCPTAEKWRWYTISREQWGRPGAILQSALEGNEV